ncbi:MAG TPA: response regulator [Alphaproteobacteria bacterium]|nr:response regulator [Alphaproteobacteria bacterium]
MAILLADDDVHLANFLSKSLESEGYSVHTALDADSVLFELKRQNYKLIILDLNFGKTDGLQLLEKLRAEGLTTPVMVLSARNKVSDRIQSLNLGADDYVTKPFSFQELSARANALLRRKADPALNVLRLEDLELDPALRRVTRGGRNIKLSPKEFDLLHMLLRRAGETVSRQELLRQSWGLQPETDSNLIDVYVNYLRKKIDLPTDEKLIYTVRGAGYRLGRPDPGAAGTALLPKNGKENGSAAHAASQSTSTFPATHQQVVQQQTPLRALVNSVAHDLAQPLTSVRCFLEVVGMQNGKSSLQANDLKNIEQQADRAIALAKTVSSLMRDVPTPSAPWKSLDALLDEVLEDFTVLQHSGLLAIDRQCEPSIQITSSQVLRQLLVLFVGKLVGRNSKSMMLTVTAHAKGGRCTLGLAWRSTESGGVHDAKTVLSKELLPIQDMVSSIGADLVLGEGKAEISLTLPCAPQNSSSEKDAA